MIQKARHFVGGFEIDLFKHVEIQVEAYQKYFTQMASVNRDKLFDDTPENDDKPDANKKDFIMEQGSATGLDFTAKFEKKRFYFWAVYSYATNLRWSGDNSTNQVIQYPPNFDRRHNINLVTSYAFGKTKNFELNARFNFGTGFPFTPTQGFVNQFNPGGNINYNFNTANGLLSYIPGTINSYRLPDYARFDIGFKYKYHISETSLLEFNVGATNILNRENIFYVDRFTFERINQLPIMPSVNISFSF